MVNPLMERNVNNIRLLCGPMLTRDGSLIGIKDLLCSTPKSGRASRTHKCFWEPVNKGLFWPWTWVFEGDCSSKPHDSDSKGGWAEQTGTLRLRAKSLGRSSNPEGSIRYGTKQPAPLCFNKLTPHACHSTQDALLTSTFIQVV